MAHVTCMSQALAAYFVMYLCYIIANWGDKITAALYCYIVFVW
jgi:hypothetical protein